MEVLLEEGFTSTDIASALIHHLQRADGAAATASPRLQREPERERPGRQHEPRELPRREPRGRSERDFVIDRERRPERPVRRETKVPSEEPRKVAPAPPVAVAEEPERRSEPRSHLPPAAKPSPAKQSRRTPSDKTRLYINVGSAMGVAPRDIVGAVMGETGLPPEVVGTIDVRERHLFADVASEHANSIIAKLNRSRIKDHRVKVKLA